MTPEILKEVHSHTGFLTLNRPAALNSLTLEATQILDQALVEWEQDPTILQVVIQGAGRAFCAGGDIRHTYQAQLEKDFDYTRTFFEVEYNFNRRLHHFSKPYVALLHGITMGGGMGVSLHGSHRLVTERAVLAMPETKIGFFPDVGIISLLQRCPGAVGLYLALTGVSISAADALYAGLTTHFIPQDQVPHFIELLKQGISLDKALKETVRPCPFPSSLATHQDLIDRCFQQSSYEEIYNALRQEKSLFAQSIFHMVQTCSPQSLKITFAHYHGTKGLDFDALMDKEFALSQYLAHSPEFHEGIRAAVIDKDRSPRWPSQG